jgi:hypothetical protein
MLIACALFAASAAAEEVNCPAFPQPDAAVQWVAPYMIFNGVPMSVKRFDSEQKPEAILAFYRRAWAGSGADAPVENVVGPWQTIGAVRGKCFFSVQVQPAGVSGSTGLLSATERPDKVRIISPDQKLPMMSGSTIINDIEHRDNGKNARTLLLSNTFSAESNADFYRRNLADQGWAMVSSYQLTTSKGPGITIVMKRGLAEANLVISRSGANTMILATMVDKP